MSDNDGETGDFWEWDGPTVLLARRLRVSEKPKEHAMKTKAEHGPIATVGIDTGKNTLHLIGLDRGGNIVMRRKCSRVQAVRGFANMQRCLVGIEACVGAHHLSRELLALGHDVKLIPAVYAIPFRKSHKNDFRDAEAIAEAVQRPTMRFVPTKTPEQLDLQALHRVRARLISQRTAVINQIRCFLLERGLAVRKGVRFLRQALPELLATRTDVLSPRMIHMLEDLSGDWRRLDGRIEDVTGEIEALAAGDEACRRLMTIPGIGPIIASAMVAAVGDGAAFRRGRDFAAWLGLVPRQISTGDRTILGRISKRGNRYLRMLFMQGARVLLLRPANWPKHSFGPWLAAAAQRLHRNVLATALANKLARIAWSVLTRDDDYAPMVRATAA
jgi:transposase